MKRSTPGRSGAPGPRLSLVAVAGLLALAACTTPPPAQRPPAAETPPMPTAAERARDDYEKRLRAQAGTATAERRWNDAVLAWELLATLHPADPLIAERLAESRQRTQAAVADLEMRADQAVRRGDLDSAAQRWWAVLALDPTNPAAAAGLRKLESERNRKTVLGRHAGSTLTRRAVAEAEAMPSGAARPVAPSRPDLERASALAADGDFEAATTLLEERIAARPGDATAFRLLIDVYHRQAEALETADPAQARKALERSERLASGTGRFRPAARSGAAPARVAAPLAAASAAAPRQVSTEGRRNAAL